MNATTAAPLFAPDLAAAERYRAAARDCHRERADSIERSDTDGFMSQWAAGKMASRYEYCAKLAENGHAREYPAVFDLDGNLVAAKQIETRYGWSWGLLESDDPRSRITGWFNASAARDDARRRRTDAAKGYYVGRVMAACYSNPGNWEACGKRRDGGFSRDVVILDNGK